MPNVKLSDLTPATTAADADLIETTQSGVSKKSTISIIKAWILKDSTLTGTATVGQLNPTTDSATSLGTAAKRFLGGWFIAPVSLPAYNVSGLPAAASWPRGVAIAVDALSPVKGAAVVGGGSIATIVLVDGGVWKVG